jgi:glycosyltransferase involved in cell wall biosynthesis
MPAPLRVAIVRWAEPIGGVERVLRDFAVNVDRTRFEVKFIYLACAGAFEKEMLSSGHLFVTIPARGGYDIGARIRLISELRKFRPQVIQDHGLPPLIRPLIWLAIKAPMIPFDHGIVEINHRRGNAWKNVLYGLELRLFAKCVVFNSRYNRDSVVNSQNLSLGKTRVAPLGLDIREFPFRSQSSTDKRLVLAYSGRISNADKGTGLLPRLVKMIMDSGIRGLQFRVFGDGSDRVNLEQEVEMLGLKDNFLFMGARNDIAQQLGLVDILVVPSQTEAFGLSPVEALSVGTRVVAFAVGALPETLQNCPDACLVPSNDLGAMAEAIRTMWQRFGKTRAQAGRKFVEAKFGVIGMVHNMETCLLEAAS